jgi:hypothetical protein
LVLILDFNYLTTNFRKKKPIERPWVKHLAENKAKWQELAEIEKKEKQIKIDAAAAAAVSQVQDVDKAEGLINTASLNEDVKQDEHH